MKDLETEHLKIREFRVEDAKDVHENLASEQQLADCSGYHIHKSIEETKVMVNSFIKEYEMNELIWGIEEKSTNRVIGFIRATEVSRTSNRCDIKFGIGLKWVNTGLMEEALERVLKYLFEEEKIEIIISTFYDSYKKVTDIKEKMLKNVGMQKEASLRNRRINEKTGAKENLLVYSILKEEFEK